MQKIIIIGNAIAAEVLYGFLKSDKRYDVVAFCVDRQYITEQQVFSIQVIELENLQERFSTDEYKLIIGMGYNNINIDRAEMFDRVTLLGYEVETYIHPEAKVIGDNKIGKGCIILANSVIEPFVSIGNNSVVWSNCTVAHHAVIENNCWIASGCVIAGEAKIKANCFLGVNSTVVNNVVVEEYNIVGANTLISKNTKTNEVYLARSGEKHRFPAKDYANFLGV